MKKAVFHIDELEKWTLALTNTKNLVGYYQERKLDFQIEVVATSVAIRGYLGKDEGDLPQRMAELHQLGVVFAACSNAMRAQKVEPQDLPDFVRVVPAGVAELVDRQEEGYAYLRP